MPTAELLQEPAAADPEPKKPAGWPEGIPRDGVELGRVMQEIKSLGWEMRMQLMGAQSPKFVEIKRTEDRLSPLTYSARPFASRDVADGLREDLQLLKDLYGMGNAFGRAYRGARRTVQGWFTRAPAAQE